MSQFSLGSQATDFFWLHRAFRICSTWHVFCPCFDKKRLRDLPRQITRHDSNYLYLWEFQMHSTDNTNSSFLLTLISILILSLLTLSVQSESCLQLVYTFYVRLLPSGSTGLYAVKHMHVHKWLHSSDKQNHSNTALIYLSDCEA